MFVNQLEIDGVAVLWADVPGPLTATLTFGVGARDESFHSIGVTHMVEHLAMGTLPKLHHEHNASVDVEVTEFTATGRPEQIVSFLHTICTALADLPMNKLTREAGVLEAEGGHSVHPTATAMLRARYGAVGSGLTYYAGPGFDRLTEQTIREHVRRHFVSGNAVLTLTGPPPEGLGLPLLKGDKPPARAWKTLPQPGPQWVPSPLSGAGLMLRGRTSAGWTMAATILEERLIDIARHEHGLSYDIGGNGLLAEDGYKDYSFTLDAREGQDVAVARLAWQEVNRLATEGPSQAELEHALTGFREMLADPRWPYGAATVQAHRLLFDLAAPTDEQRLAELAALRSEDIMACVTEALPTALVAVGGEGPPGIDGVAAGGCPIASTVPDGKQFAPPLLARAINKSARGHRLVLTQTGVAHVDGDGGVHVIDFDQVAGVQTGERQRVVFGLNGCVVPVDLDLFPSAKSMFAPIDAAVPAHLRFALTDRSLPGAGRG